VAREGTGYEWVAARLFVQGKFSDDARNEVNDMVHNLRTAFKGLLDESAWMSAETIPKAKDKVEAIIQNLGYPDWILDDKEFERFHEILTKPGLATHLENNIQLQTWQQKNALNRMITPEPRDDFIMPPSMVNAAYMPTLNSISMHI